LAIGLKVRSQLYIPPEKGKYYVFVGALIGLIGAILDFKKLKNYLKIGAGLLIGFTLTIVAFKGLYRGMYLATTPWANLKATDLVKRIFLANSESSSWQKSSYSRFVAAANGGSQDDLYAGLKKVKGSSYTEDVGRYIGFGWKWFYGKGWSSLASKMPSCFSLDKDIRYLCENHEVIEQALVNLDDPQVLEQLQSVFSKVQKNKYLKKLIEDFFTTGSLADKYSNLTQISQYYQNNSIKTVDALLYNPAVTPKPE